MLALALHEEENLSVKSVATTQGISEKYLEQVIPVLVRRGFVKSGAEKRRSESPAFLSFFCVPRRPWPPLPQAGAYTPSLYSYDQVRLPVSVCTRKVRCAAVAALDTTSSPSTMAR